MDDIDKIILNSSKAELMEQLDKLLVNTDKIVVVLIEDKDKGKYTSQVLALGISTSYEACGILDVAKQDWLNEDYRK